MSFLCINMNPLEFLVQHGTTSDEGAEWSNQNRIKKHIKARWGFCHFWTIMRESSQGDRPQDEEPWGRKKSPEGRKTAGLTLNLEIKRIKTFMVSRGWMLLTFKIPWPFYTATEGLPFWWNRINCYLFLYFWIKESIAQSKDNSWTHLWQSHVESMCMRVGFTFSCNEWKQCALKANRG